MFLQGYNSTFQKETLRSLKDIHKMERTLRWRILITMLETQQMHIKEFMVGRNKESEIKMEKYG